MRRIAKFEKVSEERFLEDLTDAFPEYTKEQAKEIYASLRLPERATKGSAGYDFYMPVPCSLKPGETVKIPHGRAGADGGGLGAFPLSQKRPWLSSTRLQLNNTVGIIDSDYYYSDNEGHIFAKLTNDSNEGKALSPECGRRLHAGKSFLPYGITEDDAADGTRNGGSLRQHGKIGVLLLLSANSEC